MNNIVVQCNDATYTRISKPTARKVWGTATMALCPHKLRPGAPYHFSVAYAAREQRERSFDEVVKWFEHWNCGLHEVGYYSAFYLVTPEGSKNDYDRDI